MQDKASDDAQQESEGVEGEGEEDDPEELLAPREEEEEEEEEEGTWEEKFKTHTDSKPYGELANP